MSASGYSFDDLTALVTAAQAGDLAAFNRLVVHFQDLAYATAYGWLGQRDQAEEAVQDSFVQVFLCLRELQTPRAFVPWFRQIVVSRCDRQVRGSGVVTANLAAAEELTAEEADPMERQELQQWVGTAVGELPEGERSVVGLFYLTGYSHAEIAALLELPISTVKKRLHDARRHLRARLETQVIHYFTDLRPSRDDRMLERIRHRLLLMAWDKVPGRNRLFTLSPDRGGPEPLGPAGRYHHADWFPGGDRILCTDGPVVGGEPIVQHQVVDAKTGARRPVGPRGCIDQGRVSPDGRQVVYVSNIDHPDLYQEFRRNELYLLDLVTQQVRRLTHNEVCDASPVWAPDGRILFCRDVSGYCHLFQLLVINPDGTGEEPFPAAGAETLGNMPSYSPDGMRIAFTQWERRQHDMWVMNADATDRRQLTTLGGVGGMPTWSPDGTQLAFVAHGQLYLIDADGSSGQRLEPVSTGLSGSIGSVAWARELEVQPGPRLPTAERTESAV